MKHYLIFKDEDNSVVSAIFQSGELQVPANHWAMETTLDVFNEFNNYLSSNENFLNKLMIYKNGGLVFVDRDMVPCNINKTSLTADGVDYIKITDIPVGSRLLIKGLTEFIINDGEFILTTKIPETFNIKIMTPYYRDRGYTINAT